MRVSREQAEENRERVLATAARLYREHGFDGVGVADIMKAAGLTHGGFYGQFGSKDELMAEVSERALAESHALWQKVAEKNPENPLAAFAETYLSPKHRDNPGAGCVLAALSSDLARSPGPVRQAITAGMRGFIDLLVSAIPGRSKAARREKALMSYAAMVGALVLSRAVGDQDLSVEILEAVRSSLRRTAGAD